ncbi:hypothetical protein ABZX30_27570 [Streptomyces sp. NPDC004542]|uniref:hypothetical protein n=1 Tax=Streptomyces sp. NPDC004542 TaxID=3154281 RepID=UPI0033B76029
MPSEVLTRRPGARRGDLEPTDDPKTALTAVMGATGGVDLPLIASLLGTTPEEARRLGTELFDNPVTKKQEAGARRRLPVRAGTAETGPGARGCGHRPGVHGEHRRAGSGAAAA